MNLTIAEALQQGIAAHKEGKLEEADRFYTAILKKHPMHADANHNMGILAVGVGKVEQSLSFFRAAVDTNPNIEQFWLSYVDALLKIDRIDDAKKLLEKASALTLRKKTLDNLKIFFASNRPNGFLANYRSGELAVSLNQGTALLKDYPLNIDIRKIVASIYLKLSQHENAIHNLRLILRVKPDDADVYAQLAQCHNEMGEHEIGKRITDYALKVEPTLAIAYNHLGNSFHEMGNLKAALSQYFKAAILTPNYFDVYYNIGISFNGLGYYTIARSNYAKGIVLRQNDARIYNNLGNCLDSLGFYERAIEAYENAIEVAPTYGKAKFNLGVAFYSLGKLSDAAEYFASTDHDKSRSYLLRCLFLLNAKQNFFKLLDKLIKNEIFDAVTGALVSQAELKFGQKRINLFCEQPFSYVSMIDLNKQVNFQVEFKQPVINLLNSDLLPRMEQHLLINGEQTTGNLFAQGDVQIQNIQKIIRRELLRYRDRLKNSNEGFMRQWPKNFELNAWVIKMTDGGNLKPHIHENGWVSGSIYISVPEKNHNDSGNLVVCLDNDANYDTLNNDRSMVLDIFSGAMCLFPASLHHFTIPFKSSENRIVLAFDMIPLPP